MGAGLLLMTALAAPGCRRGNGASCRDVVQRFADGPLGEITSTNSVRQVFVPNHDGLNGVATLMATWGRANRCEVIVRVRREGVEADVANARYPCQDVKDNDWLRMEFKPVSDSKGKQFVLSVESPDAAPGNAVTVWKASVRGIYSDGGLSVGGDLVPGALTFETFHGC